MHYDQRVVSKNTISRAGGYKSRVTLPTPDYESTNSILPQRTQTPVETLVSKNNKHTPTATLHMGNKNDGRALQKILLYLSAASVRATRLFT